MREILFRGKRADTGEWVEGYFGIKRNGNKKVYCIMCETANYNYNETYFTDYEVIPETVGQYTGLTDRNGKRIFEGDILRPFDNEIVVVSWEEHYSTLGLTVYAKHTEKKRGKEITHTYKGMALLLDYELSENEVIGNIHDNPDLLT